MKSSEIQVGEVYALSYSGRAKGSLDSAAPVKVVQVTAPSQTFRSDNVIVTPLEPESMQPYQSEVHGDVRDPDTGLFPVIETKDRRQRVRPQQIMRTWAEHVVLKDKADADAKVWAENRERAQAARKERLAVVTEQLEALGVDVKDMSTYNFVSYGGDVKITFDMLEQILEGVQS